MPITRESLGVGPQNLKKLLRFNSVCAAVVQVTVAVYCHPQFVFGIVGYTGRASKNRLFRLIFLRGKWPSLFLGGQRDYTASGWTIKASA